MSLFGFLKKGKTRSGFAARLVWFELQVTPSAFRFAFTPGQPVLVGYAGDPGQKAVSALINPEQAATLYERTIGQVDALLKKNEILYLPLTQAEQAFAPAALKTPGVHVRFAYEDDMSWASVYPRDKLPPQISTLLTETRALARQIMQQLSPGFSVAQAAGINPPDETVKIRVSRSGAIFANGKEVSVAELNTFLDDLKAKGGELAYSRESSGEEQSESTTKSIQILLEAVMERKLPIRLEVPQEELL